MKADPLVVNLREKTLYYYELGQKLAQYCSDSEINQVVIEVNSRFPIRPNF